MLSYWAIKYQDFLFLSNNLVTTDLFPHPYPPISHPYPPFPIYSLPFPIIPFHFPPDSCSHNSTLNFYVFFLLVTEDLQ